MSNVVGKAFTFTVEVSNLPCGLKGGLKFVEMDSDGRMAKDPENGQIPSSSFVPRTVKTGNGRRMTRTQARVSTAADAARCTSGRRTRWRQHACHTGGGERSSSDFNSLRICKKTFWVPGHIVDTNKPVQVVTQFMGAPGVVQEDAGRVGVPVGPLRLRRGDGDL
jgi:cellulose 1,4-beta-cellobiosidase